MLIDTLLDVCFDMVADILICHIYPCSLLVPGTRMFSMNSPAAKGNQVPRETPPMHDDWLIMVNNT